MQKILVVLIFCTALLANPISYDLSITEFQTAPDSMQKVELFFYTNDPYFHNFEFDSIVTNSGSYRIAQLYPLDTLICQALPPGSLNKDFDTLRVYGSGFSDKVYWPAAETTFCCEAASPAPPSSASASNYGDPVGYRWWYIDYTPTFDKANDDWSSISGLVTDGSHNPVKWAAIIAKAKFGRYSSGTDSIGHYTIKVSKGKYLLEVRKGSYRTVYPESIDVPFTGHIDNINIVLNGIGERGNDQSKVSALYIYPNPTNYEVGVKFQVPQQSDAKLSVFDATGRLVKVIFRGATTIGLNTAVWNRLDMHGKPVAVGFYFVTLDAGKYSVTKKLVLTK